MGATLPGTIPGLLRRGSPVVLDGEWRCVVIEVDHAMSRAHVTRADFRQRVANVQRLTLDLTYPTGRVHAAWWFKSQPEPDRRRAAASVSGPDAPVAVMDACDGDTMTDDEVDALRRLVLAAANLKESP